jgi:hypothetical protein
MGRVSAAAGPVQPVRRAPRGQTASEAAACETPCRVTAAAAMAGMVVSNSCGMVAGVAAASACFHDSTDGHA